MANQFQTLVAIGRAEFARAERVQGALIALQLAITATSAATVFVTDEGVAYLTGIAALLLSAMWAAIRWYFDGIRTVAETARRASLLVGGLGQDISREDFRDIQARASSSAHAQTAKADNAYYAPSGTVGSDKLADMIEESAFWSCHLMRACAIFLGLIFAIALATSLAMVFASVPFIGTQDLLNAIRVFCAALSLLVSAGFLGAALAYSGAADIINRIPSRLERTRSKNFPMSDLMTILGDYNSAVESAPLFVPGIYRVHRDKLNRLWQDSRREAQS